MKGICVAQDFLGDGNESIFRDLLGRAVCFAHRIEGAADPPMTGLGDLSAIALSTATTHHHTSEGVCFLFHTRMGVLIGTPLYLLLHSVKLSQGYDWFVAVRHVVFRKRTVIW